MDYQELTPEELLGPLNEVEQKNAPEKLFLAGNADVLKARARVAIVGSRKASPQGLARARKLAGILCDRSVVVVSGLAAGIDTAAHKTAIERGGKTVAVLGTPLDKVYPRENAGLQDVIQREHLCVSQYPVGYPTRPGNFPMRNRTMALVSDATVIIEAGPTSGSLSQGWEALRLGRGLWISKALTEDPSLDWPEKMVHYGACILADDTVEQLFEMLPECSRTELNGSIPF